MPALTPDQRRVLESGPHHVYLFVNASSSGDHVKGPIGYPMTGIFERGSLWFTTYRAAAKVRHLLADDRVCCLFAPPADEAVPARVLSVRGRASLSADTSAFTRVRDDAPLEVPAAVRDKVTDRLSSGLRVVFEVSIEAAHFLSADHSMEAIQCRVPISP